MFQDIQRSALIEAAFRALPRAYAPYSGFHVAAALLGESGTVYTGVNVENASFPAGTCAERSALNHAVSEGEKNFRAIAIIGGKHGKITTYCAPCGVCRQALREFCDPKEFLVILARTSDDYIEKTLDELLPMSFGPDDLV